MRSGITRQALRRHRWTLAGPACTQLLGAAVIAVMIMTAWSLTASGLSAADQHSVHAGGMADTTAVFLGDSVYLSMIVVAVTMSLAVSRQLRDIALLRSIGATPGQLRRSVVLQALAVSLPASVLGFAMAVPLGYGWVALLRSHGALPDAVRFTPELVVLPIVAGIQLATSVVGAGVAGRRTTRLAPAIALSETSGDRRHIGPVRSALGLLLVGGGVVGSVVVSSLAADQADAAALFVLLAECIGIGALAPVVLRAAAAVFRPLLPDGLPRLALDNISAMSRPLAGTLVPLVLSMAFAGVKVAVRTTSAAVTGSPGSPTEVWTDYSGTTVFCAFAGVAALNALVTVIVARGLDLAVLQLAGGTRLRLLLMVTGEAALVAATAVLLAGVAAGATLLPMLHTSLGTWLPRFPAPVLATGLLLALGVVTVGMVLPAAVLTRRPPLQRMGGAG
jgi:putative ABC transport system permease protein